ncbi:hypothetical protein RYX36_032677 [Vicia faba]
MPCNNSDCVYLHEIGSQEDSFTKDEIVSAYTSHVQHITGVATNMERRSRNVLPPPLDDCTSNTSEKPTVKNTSSNSVCTVRGSPPNGSPAKLMVPPAAWGLRATNCQPTASSLSCPTGLSKPKPDSISSTSFLRPTDRNQHPNSCTSSTSSPCRHVLPPFASYNSGLLQPLQFSNSPSLEEEEAVRCIQNVHGFVLESRPLRACFGTTKYCHAWLRNMPCNNPDCVYLHEIGSQEDSFTKDEIVSAYTSHVQHITGAATNMERRSGNVLPPPLDDCTSNTSEKPTVKNTSSNSVCTVRGSPPNGSPAKLMVPPAAWGLRATNCQPTASSLSCPTGLSKPKPDSISNTSFLRPTDRNQHPNSCTSSTSSPCRHVLPPFTSYSSGLLQPLQFSNSPILEVRFYILFSYKLLC